MNIHDFLYKVKELKDSHNTREIYTICLILVVGFGSFGLGRLSKLEEGKTSIRIEQASAAVLSTTPSSLRGGAESAPPAPEGRAGRQGSPELLPKPSSFKEEGVTPLASGGQVVASKSGGKYHFPWCSGAQRISGANKIYFSSIEEARKAGYTPASNCKGLK